MSQKRAGEAAKQKRKWSAVRDGQMRRSRGEVKRRVHGQLADEG